jgi:hypothetical protein
MKIIVSATLLQKAIKQSLISADDPVTVWFKHGHFVLRQEHGVYEEIPVTCKEDFGPIPVNAESLINLELQLRVLGYDFPLVMSFEGSRIRAEFYL